MKPSLPLLQIDQHLRHWAVTRGAEEQQYTVLMPETTLKKAGYHEAFPHLLMTAAIKPEPVAETETLQSAGWCLSPAVCYHAYASLEARQLESGIRITAKGHCFRNEEVSELNPGRRQVEFQMRELVLIGHADWIQTELEGVQEELRNIASEYQIHGAWTPASDPFFLPVAKGKAHMQRLLGTKLEYCLPDGLSIASINKHGDFFGKRFSITAASGGAAHSACIAFGLDRWASQAITSTK